MKYYRDIKLLSVAEISFGFLWKKVYQQIHLALVEAGNKQIAFSFPNYSFNVEDKKNKPNLGEVLRVFAHSIEELESMELAKWLERLSDYVQIGRILQTPEVTEFVQFKRKQFKFHDDIVKRAQHQADRRGISLEEALKHFEGYNSQQNKLPFIMCQSLSTNQEYKIFIEQKKSTNEIKGSFDTFGLSKEATVPWF